MGTIHADYSARADKNQENSMRVCSACVDDGAPHSALLDVGLQHRLRGETVFLHNHKKQTNINKQKR